MTDPETPSAEHWTRNHLLAALPPAEQQQLFAQLQLVALGLKDPLHEPGRPIRHVYFPLTSVISLIATVDQDSHIEVATTGSEGMVGLPAFLGATTSPHQSFCQVPGQAARLDVQALHQLLTANVALHHLLHRYTQATMVFLAQNIACNQLHAAEQRAARWLAHTHDRVGADTFPLTQEFLSQMLGVRRATISHSAAALQQARLIRYSRGQITVLDPAGLRGAACSCYQLIQEQFTPLAQPPPQTGT